jgi:hypothetical protein
LFGEHNKQQVEHKISSKKAIKLKSKSATVGNSKRFYVERMELSLHDRMREENCQDSELK